MLHICWHLPEKNTNGYGYIQASCNADGTEHTETHKHDSRTKPGAGQVEKLEGVSMYEMT